MHTRPNRVLVNLVSGHGVLSILNKHHSGGGISIRPDRPIHWQFNDRHLFPILILLGSHLAIEI